MKKLTMLGVLLGSVTFGSAAFAAEGGTLQDRELQKLFQWSAQAVKSDSTVARAGGPMGESADTVPAFREYRGNEVR